MCGGERKKVGGICPLGGIFDQERGMKGGLGRPCRLMVSDCGSGGEVNVEKVSGLTGRRDRVDGTSTIRWSRMIALDRLGGLHHGVIFRTHVTRSQSLDGIVMGGRVFLTYRPIPRRELHELPEGSLTRGRVGRCGCSVGKMGVRWVTSRGERTRFSSQHRDLYGCIRQGGRERERYCNANSDGNERREGKDLRGRGKNAPSVHLRIPLSSDGEAFHVGRG